MEPTTFIAPAKAILDALVNALRPVCSVDVKFYAKFAGDFYADMDPELHHGATITVRTRQAPLTIERISLVAYPHLLARLLRATLHELPLRATCPALLPAGALKTFVVSAPEDKVTHMAHHSVYLAIQHSLSSRPILKKFRSADYSTAELQAAWDHYDGTTDDRLAEFYEDQQRIDAKRRAQQSHA